MQQKAHATPLGTIVYWTNDIRSERKTLVMLPGLTADHRLFDRQIGHFESTYNILVWDAPGHAASRPFNLSFSLADKARWLHKILEREGIASPVLVGQSMGGYVSQAFMELYPGEAAAFVSIDSAPLQKRYMSRWEISLMRHIEPVYRMYPWRTLVRSGAAGCAETEYGRKLMREMMEVYADDPRYYCHLTADGYRMLADAIDADLSYKIDCPAVLLCGDHDRAGTTRKYNRVWAEETGLPLVWIHGAGHNSNTDNADEVNEEIEKFAVSIV